LVLLLAALTGRPCHPRTPTSSRGHIVSAHRQTLSPHRHCPRADEHPPSWPLSQSRAARLLVAATGAPAPGRPRHRPLPQPPAGSARRRRQASQAIFHDGPVTFAALVVPGRHPPAVASTAPAEGVAGAPNTTGSLPVDSLATDDVRSASRDKLNSSDPLSLMRMSSRSEVLSPVRLSWARAATNFVRVSLRLRSSETAVRVWATMRLPGSTAATNAAWKPSLFRRLLSFVRLPRYSPQ